MIRANSLFPVSSVYLKILLTLVYWKFRRRKTRDERYVFRSVYLKQEDVGLSCGAWRNPKDSNRLFITMWAFRVYFYTVCDFWSLPTDDAMVFKFFFYFFFLSFFLMKQNSSSQIIIVRWEKLAVKLTRI